MEFGTRTGVSTSALLYSRPKWMRSYDIKLTPKAIQLAQQANLEGIDYALIEADTKKIVIEPCDLLFIDTEHTDVQCSRELIMHEKKVSKYIILHDTETFAFAGEKKGTRGLMFSIVDFLRRNPKWRVREHFSNSHGLTILGPLHG